jgi:hypothetical protein
MSRFQFRSGGGNSVVEVEIDPARMWGNNNAAYPYLSWQMELRFFRSNAVHTDHVFRKLEAQLYILPGKKIADARPVTLNYIQRGYYPQEGGETPTLEFPMDSHQFESLEKYRAGGAIRLGLWMQLWADEFGPIPEETKTKRPQMWGLKAVHQLNLQEEINISQSDWIDHVLSRVGHGQIQIVEMPAVPIESFEALKHSYLALRQAQDLHRKGLYDDAVGKCRVALDPFFESVEKKQTDEKSGETIVKRVPKMKKSFEAHIGKATYAWLADMMAAVKDASNRPHHSPNAHYSQFDSQMIIGITISVVSYAARTIPPEDLA